MVRDPTNPSSIASCLKQARENARAVRGALTTEAWEIQNATWIKMQSYLQTDAVEQNPSEFFEWVKHRSHLSRGVTIGTMLKDEAFHFIRLGTFLERADNTARIIDVKFHGTTETADKQSQQQSQGLLVKAPIARSISITGRRFCVRCPASRFIARCISTLSRRNASPSC